jgi:hypothetical protein
MPDKIYEVELTVPKISPYKAGNTGIDNVTTFTSGSMAPNVLVTALVHGNEILLRPGP